MALRDLKGDIFVFEKIKNGLKGVKRFMDKKAQMCKDMLASRSNRVVAGVVIVSLGIGLIVSGYMPLPS